MKENILSEDHWHQLDKAFGDYLLWARAHQSTQSRYKHMDDKGWPEDQDGQVLARDAVHLLDRLKSDYWKALERALGDNALAEWGERVDGMSAGQAAFISGSYATCFLPERNEEGEIVEPARGVPNVTSAWAYHGLDTAEDPNSDRRRAPSYRSGEKSYFDRDLRAKLVHRVGGMVYMKDNYYQERYQYRREKKANDPAWDDEPPAHHHADALRYVTKEIIKDWWRVLHGQRPHALLSKEAAA